MCKNNDPRADWAYDVAHRKTIGMFSALSPAPNPLLIIPNVDFNGLEKAANMTFSSLSIDQILQQQEEEMQSEVQELLGLVTHNDEAGGEGEGGAGGGSQRQGSPSSSRVGGNLTDGESSRPMTPAEIARKKAKEKRAKKMAWKNQFGGGGEEVVGTIDD